MDQEYLCGKAATLQKKVEECARRSPWKTKTTEAEDWADILFDPLDLIDLRCFPSKGEIARQAQRQLKFCWWQTRKAARIGQAQFGGAFPALVEPLVHFNRGNEPTYWWDKTASKTTVTLPDIALNVYCGINPRQKAGGRKTEDVKMARCLVVDLEHVRISRAKQWLKKKKVPKPTMLVNSGFGVHVYWKLAAPLTDLRLWTWLQKNLAKLFPTGDTSIHDPPRVVRIPGFYNIKHEIRPCFIHDICKERVYEVQEFIDLFPPLPPPPPAATQKKSKTTSRTRRPPQCDEEILERMLAYQHTVELPGDRQRNEKVFSLASNLTEKFAPKFEDLFTATTAYNNDHDDPLDDFELEEATQKAFDRIHKKGKATGTLVNSVAAVEPLPAKEPIVKLADWRKQMEAAKLESRNHPGEIFFDSSACGAGKSFSDMALMHLVKTSVSFQPTHDACHELEAKLQKEGFNAAAHPPLDQNTCDKFGTTEQPGEARKAQAAGLDVTEALCHKCEFRKTCIYQRKRKKAHNAAHSIVTHARASRNSSQPAEGKENIFVHEEPTDLLRPSLSVSQRKTDANQATHHDLRDLIDVAEEASRIANRMPDQEKVVFSDLLGDVAGFLRRILKNPNSLLPDNQADLPLEALPKVIRLPRHDPVQPVPLQYHEVLYQAMKITRTFPHGNAVKLALAYATGELDSLTLMINEFFVKKTRENPEGKEYFAALFGVWRVDLPQGKTIWFEYANGDHEQLSTLLGRKVHNATPEGVLENQIPVVQFAAKDVKQTTTPGAVRSLVRSILAKHPRAKRIGLITHRCHIAPINQLEPFFRARLKKVEYFRSGKDRASNAWLDCDLLIVLGSPRVPTSAIREGLIKLGKFEDALLDGGWRDFRWHGLTTKEVIKPVKGCGYLNPEWKRVHNLLVRDLLFQAIGRGRTVIENGVPVVVVSNEPLALPLSVKRLRPFKDTLVNTFEAVCTLLDQKLTDTFSNNILLDIMTVSCRVDEVAVLLDANVGTIRRHVRLLIHLGLLTRRAERGEITLTKAALAHVGWSSVSK